MRARIPVEGWNENDYAYIAELAHALEEGVLPLSALIWKPASPEWSREKAFAADAVSAFMAHEFTRSRESGDEDEEADNRYLREVSCFCDPNNPFARIDAADESTQRYIRIPVLYCSCKGAAERKYHVASLAGFGL